MFERAAVDIYMYMFISLYVYNDRKHEAKVVYIHRYIDMFVCVG